MSIIENLNNIQIPIDYLYKINICYKYLGKNEIYNIQMKERLEELENNALCENTLFLSNLFGLKITPDRKRLVIYKNSNIKNKQEEALLNTRNILIKINKENEKDNRLTLNSSDILEYLQFSSDKKVKFNTSNYSIKGEKNTVRFFFNKVLDDMNNEFTINKKENILLTATTLIEMYVMEPYSEFNKEAIMLLVYYLLQKSHFTVIKYFNFFEEFEKKYPEFLKIVKRSIVNYEQENIFVFGVYEFLLDFIIEQYKKLDDELSNYLIIKRSQKGDLIKNAIKYKLNNIFSKKELIDLFPNISITTIERSLDEYKNQGLITPLNTGRSAKWQKLEPLLEINETIESIMNKNNIE